MQRKKLGCVKASQNFRKICLFQLAKFCVLAAKFEIFFCKKPRGQSNVKNNKDCKTLTIGTTTAITPTITKRLSIGTTTPLTPTRTKTLSIGTKKHH